MLELGHYLKIDCTGVRENCYSDWDFHSKTSISPQEAEEVTARLMKASVKKANDFRCSNRCIVKRWIGFTNNNYLAHKERDDITAFTIAFDESEVDRSGIASQGAEAIGTNHKQLRFSEDDFCDSLPTGKNTWMNHILNGVIQHQQK